jgi:hypothetical protein
MLFFGYIVSKAYSKKMDLFYGNGVQQVQYPILMLGIHWPMFFGLNNLLALAFLKEPLLFMMKMNLREEQREKIECCHRELAYF